jgi:hypothetical protein
MLKVSRSKAFFISFASPGLLLDPAGVSVHSANTNTSQELQKHFTLTKFLRNPAFSLQQFCASP